MFTFKIVYIFIGIFVYVKLRRGLSSLGYKRLQPSRDTGFPPVAYWPLYLFKIIRLCGIQD